jgi:hypothetical protein
LAPTWSTTIWKKDYNYKQIMGDKNPKNKINVNTSS